MIKPLAWWKAVPTMRKPQSLKEFYREQFKPAKLVKCTVNSRKHYVTAIGRLCRFLDREPALGDLTQPTLDRLRQWLWDGGTARKGSKETVYLLRSIWRFAFRSGLLPDSPPIIRQPREVAIWDLQPATDRANITTLRQFAVNFYIPLRLTGKTHNAIRLHECTLRNFAKFLNREPVFSDLTDDTILRFMAWLSSRGRAAITVNDNRNRLMALARLAAKKRFIEEEPTVMLLPEPTRIPKAWSTEDLATLWEACAVVPGTIAGIPAADWWMALHECCFWTAERIGAILQLRWTDVDLATGWLVVPAEARKGGLADKSCRLPESAVRALMKIGKPLRELIFPWDRCENTLWNHYGRILKGAGLSHDRKSKFHRIRKTTASQFENAGGDATKLLGHSSRKVTLKYLDPTIVQQSQPADLLSAPGRRKGGAA
jgi:integrase